MSLQIYSDYELSVLEYVHSVCYNSFGFKEKREFYNSPFLKSIEGKTYSFKGLIKLTEVKELLKSLNLELEENDYFKSQKLFNEYMNRNKKKRQILIKKYKKLVSNEIKKIIGKTTIPHYCFDYNDIANYCDNISDIYERIRVAKEIKDLYLKNENKFYRVNIHFNVFEKIFENKILDDESSIFESQMLKNEAFLIELEAIFSEQLKEVYLNTKSFKDNINQYLSTLEELERYSNKEDNITIKIENNSKLSYMIYKIILSKTSNNVDCHKDFSRVFYEKYLAPNFEFKSDDPENIIKTIDNIINHRYGNIIKKKVYRDIDHNDKLFKKIEKIYTINKNEIDKLVFKYKKEKKPKLYNPKELLKNS